MPKEKTDWSQREDWKERYLEVYKVGKEDIHPLQTEIEESWLEKFKKEYEGKLDDNYHYALCCGYAAFDVVCRACGAPVVRAYPKVSEMGKTYYNLPVLCAANPQHVV